MVNSQHISKPKRRPTSVHLTEEEINTFIAQDDADSESDWDDIGETEISSYLASLVTQRVRSVDEYNNRITTTTSKNATQNDDAPPSSSASASHYGSSKDIGVDDLFGPVPCNLDLSLRNISPGISNAADSDSAVSDDGIGVLDSVEVDDSDRDTSLSGCGLQIQKSLEATRRKRKLLEVERHVDREITAERHTVAPCSSLPVDAALAASSARRKKVLSDLAKTHPTSNLPEGSVGIASVCSGSWTALPTNLRIYRSQISSDLWTTRTLGRQVFTLSQFLQRQRSRTTLAAPTSKGSKSGGPNSDDCVIVGVIGSNSAPRRSRNDRIYSFWCLSDLNQIGPGAPLGSVKLFLFGNCHEKLWKEAEGTVVAVLSPRMLTDPSTTTNEKDVNITLQSPQHVMILGQSPDYAICSATSKSGKPCFRVVNKSVCRFCDMHVKKAYYTASSSRPGFFDTSLPILNRLSKRYSGDLPPSSSSGPYSLPTSQMLISETQGSYASPARIKLSAARLSAAGYSVDSSTGLRASSSIRVNSCSNSSSSSRSGVIEMSTSSTRLTTPEKKIVAVLRRPTSGSLNLLRHLESTAEPLSHSDSTVGGTSDHDSNCSRLSPQKTKTGCLELGERKNTVTFSGFFETVSKQKTMAANCSEELIDLGPLPSTQPSIPITSAARLRAISLIKSRGGVQAMQLEEDKRRRRTFGGNAKNGVPCFLPNSKSKSSPLSEVLDSNGTKQAQITTGMSAATSAGAENQPPVSIDNAYKTERLNELARRVHQGSAHAGLAIVAEDQADNLRLALLERRDEAEQRLLSQTEERCTYVHCKTCNYRAWKAADVCRTQNHSLVYLKGAKRYFRCRNCSKRTATFERYPSVCCSNCGESLFEKASIIKERKGPDLPGTNLLPRGIEEKFLG